jgi:hypothetical protein
MTQLQFATDASPGGALVSDDSARATALTFATNVHGFAELRSSVPMALTEAFSRFDRAGLPHQRLNDGAGTVYEGRLEDLAINGDGITSTALGYSRALSDSPYTALWSSTDVTQWRPILASEVGGSTPDRYAFDTSNRLYITAQKNATLGNTGAGKYAMLGYLAPSQGSRSIIGVSFDYVYSLPVANWRVAFQTKNADFTGIANPWLFTSVGATGVVTGNIFVTFASAQIVNFFMDYNAADAVFSGETGSAYLIITNVRLVTSTANKVDTTTTANVLAGSNVSVPVVSSARMYVGQRLHMGIPAALGINATVLSIPDSTHFTADLSAAMASGSNVQAHVIYADEIVKDMVSAVSTLNPTQLSSSTALVQSPALDLLNESYQDQYPSDILTRLIGLGDNQATPRQWEWAVWENRQLVYQPRGSTARTWYVDLSQPNIERTLNALANSVYADYQESGGRTLRSALSSDAASIARYGVTRRTMLPVQSTSTTQVAIQQAAQLADTKDPIPRARLTVEAVFDQNGARWPLTAVRANDTIVIRNLPPTLGTVIDRVRILRAVRTELDLFSGVLTIEPESPLPSLTALLARAAAPAWVTTPWWVQIQQRS